MAANNNVSVAVRIRPKLQKEAIDMCNICTRVTAGEPQVWLGHDKAFTFDHVFDVDTEQYSVYDNCVRTLVEGCFEGYNATVLAYGQTGSGKTYTMGTGFDVSCPNNQLGIIPRAVEHLFDGIHKRKEQARLNELPLPEFTVTAQFIEIYNEELKDLLCEKSRKGMPIRIQEDMKRGIILTGVENRTVLSAEETLSCLKSGSLFRTTGATLMNSESSRSHAIFTLFVKQSRVDRVECLDVEDGTPDHELITLTAKFNFVDLAGSERLSRTGAVGERAREGISINSGLLHLGNVISALGDRSKKASHIPYRDSKLTRVLQDSLGGNSVTTMIACISPCDRDFVETLNTLRYANRAKNIKNKVVANQDSQTQLINDLRKQVMQLELENKELRQGKLFVKNDGELALNDVHLENEMLQRDLNNANIRIKALNARLDELTNENIAFKESIAMNQIYASSNGEGGEDCAEHLIKGYLKEINDLRSKVIEFEQTITYYRKQLDQRNNEALYDPNDVDIVTKCKQEIEKSKSRLNQINSPKTIFDGNDDIINEDENDDLDDNDEDDINEEFEKKIAGQNAELATLMEMIASKEKLIEEAEARQRRIIELTEHYEQKISSFKNKIKQTEEERDQLMARMKQNKDDLSSKKVKEEYEKRLTQFQQEIRKYETLKREHQKVLRNEISSKEQLKKLRHDIIEAKQLRVKLISQMRDQMSKHNKEIQKNKLVINKLTREDQKKIVKIRDLELQSSRQKMILQRREDEIKALRKQVKPVMSDRAAGRLNRGITGHTPQKARNKWVNFEQKFNQLINQRISFEQEEKKLDRYLNERQSNLALINTLKENENGDSRDEYIENVQMNIDYLTKCIEDTQNVIMQLEDDNINTDKLFNSLDSDEVMYILNKLANTAVNYAIMALQKEEELKDKDARLDSLWSENVYSNHLLNYMVTKNFDDDGSLSIPTYSFDLTLGNQSGTTTTTSSETKFRRYTKTPSQLLYDISKPSLEQVQTNALQPIDINQAYGTNVHNLPEVIEEDNSNDTFVKDSSSKINALNDTFVVDSSKENARMNATFTLDNISESGSSSNKANPNPKLSVDKINDRMTQSLYIENNGVSNGGNTTAVIRKTSFNGVADLNRVPSAPSLKELNNIPVCTSSPLHHVVRSPLLRRKISHHQTSASQSSAQYPTHSYEATNNNHATNNLYNNNHSPSGKSRLTRSASHSNGHSNVSGTTQNHLNNNNNNNTSSVASTVSNTSSYHHHQPSPQSSPSLSSRHPFLHKLPGNKSNLVEYSVGKILHNQPTKTDKSFPLVCTHTIVGHRRSVLTVTATSEVLFSGSKDGTAKIWDLTKCEEVYSLNDHPDSVNVVRYDEYNKLIYTCSKSVIKIWDPRKNPVNCVRTLYSSVNENNTNDISISDIRLSEDGSTLFSAAEKLVRAWDLRSFQCVGKLNTGHKSLVTCLAVDNKEHNDTRLVITGSKDHYIKMFELNGGVNGIHIPNHTLKPPHYDGIETLRLIEKGRILFSGARDGCIKKWDLTEKHMVASLSNCHRDWVLALDTFMQESLLLSACRGGCLRVWSTENCRSFGEIQAHNMAINSIATISQAAFTASSDGTINLWQYSSTFDDAE